MLLNEQLRTDIIGACQIFLNQEDLQRVAAVLDNKFHGIRIEKEEKSLIVGIPEGEKALKNFYVAKVMKGLSTKTLKDYRLEIDRMLRYIHKDLLKVTTNDIRFYFAYMQLELGLQKSSLETKRNILQSLFGWLYNEDYILKNPMLKIEKIKFQRNQRVPFTAEEVEKLRDAAIGNSRNTAIIDILDSTGIRVAELCGIKRNDVDRDTLRLTVTGKGNKTRTVFLSSRAMLHLENYWSQRKDDCLYALVGSRKPYGKLTNRAIERVLGQLGKDSGVSDVYPHRFRHTAASNARKRGMPIEIVQRMLGHSSVDTTLIYAKIEEEELKNACTKYLAG